MPIDPNIVMNLKPVQVANPLEQYMQVQQIQQTQNQSRLADLMYGEKQREVSDSARLNDLYKGAVGADGSLDRTKLYSGVAGAGLGSRLPGIQKSFADADKVAADVAETKAKTKKADAETAGLTDKQREEKRQRAIVDIAAFKSPQEALASLETHEKAGDLTPESAAAVRATIPQNPADFPKWQIGMLQRIMSAKDIVQANETARHNGAVEQNSAGQLAVSRGQLKVAQDREKREATTPQTQYDAERGVLVDKRDGTARPVLGVDGKPLQGGQKMTEDQAKATGWLVQAENAWKNMQAVGLGKNGNLTDAAKPGRIETAISTLPFGMGDAAANSWRNADRQRFLQAASSLSEALLRAATGAGVNKEEALQKVRELTPVWGDKDENIKQKMDSIPLYIESLKVRSGPGAAKAAGVLAAGATPQNNGLPAGWSVEAH